MNLTDLYGPTVTTRERLLRTPDESHDRLLRVLGSTLRAKGLDTLEDAALLLTAGHALLLELRNSQGPAHDIEYVEAKAATDAIDDAAARLGDCRDSLEYGIRLHEADVAQHGRAA
jgi:hypothetical protein